MIRHPWKPETPRAPVVLHVCRERPPALARCRGCGAAIEWVATNRGRRMPIDQPLRVLRTHEANDGRLWVVIDSAQSHFATCPEAATFKRNGGQRR